MTAVSQKTLRSQIAEKRKELSPEAITQKSHEASARFLSLFNWKKTEGQKFYVGLYRPLPFELSLNELELEFKKRGCHLAFPRMGASGEANDSNRSMEFFEVPDLNSPRYWSVGKYGVQEPDSSLSKVAPENLSLVFVPGIAFGRSGARIGRGAGYYDRYLARAPQAFRVALSFDVQYVESDFEVQSWDQHIDCLVTETRDFRFVRSLGAFAQNIQSMKEDWIRK